MIRCTACNLTCADGFAKVGVQHEGCQNPEVGTWVVGPNWVEGHADTRAFMPKAGEVKRRDWVGIAAECVSDRVEHPKHYTAQVPGIECWDVTQHFNFNRGNAIKYVWRAGSKDDLIEDLKKAIQYINHEIARVVKERGK